jgi:hypothetical protein
MKNWGLMADEDYGFGERGKDTCLQRFSFDIHFASIEWYF